MPLNIKQSVFFMSFFSQFCAPFCAYIFLKTLVVFLIFYRLLPKLVHLKLTRRVLAMYPETKTPVVFHPEKQSKKLKLSNIQVRFSPLIR